MVDPSQGQAKDFQAYMNMEHGIWIKYPPTWQVVEDAGAAAFMVYFLSPMESPTDKFRENLNVVVESLPGPATLEQVVAAARQVLAQQLRVTYLEQDVPDQVSGLPAYRSTYTGTLMERFLKWQQFSIVKGNRSYTLTYTAEPAKFDAFLGTIHQMVATLEIS